MKKTFFRKLLSLVSAWSLLLNQFLPIASVMAVPAYAEEATTSAETEGLTEPEASVVESSPSPELSPEPSPEATTSAEVIVPSPESSVEPAAVTETEEPGSESSEPPKETGPPAEESPQPSPVPEVKGNLNAAVLPEAGYTGPVYDLESQNEISACLVTDKPDYAPTEVVVISGTEFVPNETYALVISSSDEPAVRFETNIAANDQGEFVYAYQLDGVYRPNYLVEAFFAGTLIASVSFTDSPPKADLDQCRNGAKTSPVSPCDWVNGSANASNSHYVEGFSVPYRIVMTDLPTATPITLTIGYDIKHSSKHAIDFITHYDRLQPHSVFGHAQETVDPTIGVTGVSGAPTSTLAIPAPSSAGSPVAGQPTTSFNSLPAGEKVMSLWNGTITTIAYVSEGDLTAAQDDTTISITFIASNPTAVLAWGGHIGREIDWGTDNSAGGISGAPYHTRLESWTLGNLGNTDKSLSADAIALPSSITIIKDADPDDPQDFSFTTTGNGLSSFSLDDDSDPTLDNTISFTGLLAGAYTVTETLVSGWSLDSVSCQSDGTGGTTSPITNGVSINLVAGENVSCTFTNTRDQGTLTVNKVLIPADDPGKFNLQIDGQTAGTGANVGNGGTTGAVTVLPGLHLIGETAGDNTDLADYSTTYGGDCTSEQVTVATGENKVCTITNTRLGSISGYKYEDADGDLSTTADRTPLENWLINLFVWDISAWLDTGQSDTTDSNGYYEFSDLLPALYQVREVLQAGWKNLSSLTQDVDLPAGGNDQDNNFINTHLGTIKVVKDVIPDDSSSWEFYLTGPNSWGARFPLTDGDDQKFIDKLPGTYTITETGDSAYTTTFDCGNKGSGSGTFVSFNLDPGEDVICRFTNSRLPVLTLVKTVINDNGGTATESDFNVYIDKVQSSWGSHTLTPGDYAVSEDVVPGYSPSGWGGDCSPEGVVNLAYGDNKTCSITNDDISPQLTVVKHVNNDDGGTAVASDFTMNVTGTNVSSSSFPGDEAGTTVTLDVGSYSVDEASFPGYSKSLSADCSGSIALGETKTCTITNDDIAPTLKLVKEVTNDNGGSAVPGDWTLNARTVCAMGDTNPACGFSDSGDSTTFYPLAAGKIYRLFETNGPAGYTPGSWSCNAGTLTGNKLTLGLADQVTCTITNDDIQPRLTVTKIVSGGTAQPGDFPLFVDLTQVSSGVENGFDAGHYVVSETNQPGYTAEIGGDCDTRGGVSLAPGDIKACTITNTRDMGKVIVHKQVDSDGDGSYEGGDTEANLAGFLWGLDGGNINRDMGADETVTTLDNHQVNENTVLGYQFTGWFTGEGSCTDPQSTNLPAEFTVAKDETYEMTLCNAYVMPRLEIYKSNDAAGDKTPGDSVLYTLILKVFDNQAFNVLLTDLLPEGFTFRSGSATLNGLPFSVVYSSPGVWDLGDLAEGSEVVMTLMADISSDQTPGLYKDAAWAYGCLSERDCTSKILASAQTEYVADYFVGTQVNVVKSTQESVGIDVEKEEEGEVLGASTSLPATGANSLWVILGAFLVVIGSGLIAASRKLKGLILALICLFMVAGQVQAAPGDLVIRLEEPKSPTNLNDFNISFVALDILNRTIDVQCLKKASSDAAFSQFDSTSLAAGGDTGVCQITDSVFDHNDTYQIKVLATAGGDTATDQTEIEYTTDGPGTPTDYSKDQSGCDYTIHFRTADDGGRTSKVEIYRSDNTSFTADAGTRVGTIFTGSNQDHDFVDHAPDCQKDYYYAVRAFDAAGNGSGLVGDEKIVVKTTTTTTTTTAAASPTTAIPVSGAAGGAILGEEEGAEESPSPEPGEPVTPTPQVLGARINRLLVQGLSVFLLAVLIYALVKAYKKKQA